MVVLSLRDRRVYLIEFKILNIVSALGAVMVSIFIFDVVINLFLNPSTWLLLSQ